jgi:hypothetical protein
MTGEPDGLTAVLLQLAGITQKLSELDQRQGIDTRELKDHHGALASLVGELIGTTASHAETLAALDGLDRQVAELTAKIANHGADGDGDRPTYQPTATPKFWKLDGPARDQAIGKLRGWVEQVYRPGYGHLAASLGSAGRSIRCACTSWTGCPSYGRCCTWPRRAPRGRWPGRPNGIPGC